MMLNMLSAQNVQFYDTAQFRGCNTIVAKSSFFKHNLLYIRKYLYWMWLTTTLTNKTLRWSEWEWETCYEITTHVSTSNLGKAK